MSYITFDEYATAYDDWFVKNKNVLETEVKLVAACLKDAGKILSIGCGSGLFEKILADNYHINVAKGIEPSKAMADIAKKRGIEVEINTGEEADYGTELYDTILFNGSPCYMNDLNLALRKSHNALRKGGKVVVIDVPKESVYGIMYNLALAVGTWDHPLLEGVKPFMPYPIELVKEAKWRTVADKAEAIRQAGFSNLTYKQTLFANPLYSHTLVEEPTDGCDRGSYVAICATKQ